LWHQSPLLHHTYLLKPDGGEGGVSLLRQRGKHLFAPLVCEVLKSTCELHLVMLRPEPPGSILTVGGDVDNRLKTLFDALTIPQAQAIPKKWSPPEEMQPLCCLLEDDNLITSVSVRTEQLLEPLEDKSIVDVAIFVRTRVTAMLIGNQDFA